ncbi:MAG: amidohydrolase [Fuerstiella sp.]|nr:amidohydrolase [Fuerstiella sp.]
MNTNPESICETSMMERIADRRDFLHSAAQATAAIGAFSTATARSQQAGNVGTPGQPVIDTHMHVWAKKDSPIYPFPYPYGNTFDGPPHEATVEMLIEDMDRHGCTHAVLVQVIYHGWDNTYIADCVKQYPDRLKAHGLIDPADPNVADQLRFWMKEHGLHGMRFSAIYYQNGNHGGDGWINSADTHRLWRTAADLGAVFNFFIAPIQLPKLAVMVKAYPDVPVIIDHFSQLDLGATDPEPNIKHLLAMAQYPSVRVKVSELTSVSESGTYPFSDALPVVRRLYDAFGPDRLLFGTGYPGAARAAYHRPTLDKEIDLIRHEIPFFTNEDSEKILGLNAAALWGFEQPKGNSGC